MIFYDVKKSNILVKIFKKQLLFSLRAARLLQTICQSEWNNPKVAAAHGVMQLQAGRRMGGIYF